MTWTTSRLPTTFLNSWPQRKLARCVDPDDFPSMSIRRDAAQMMGVRSPRSILRAQTSGSGQKRPREDERDVSERMKKSPKRRDDTEMEIADAFKPTIPDVPPTPPFAGRKDCKHSNLHNLRTWDRGRNFQREVRRHFMSKDMCARLIAFLSFKDMCSISNVCKRWNTLITSEAVEREVNSRWSYKTPPLPGQDLGMGIAVPFTTRRYGSDNWKKHLLIREHLETVISQARINYERKMDHIMEQSRPTHHSIAGEMISSVAKFYIRTTARMHSRHNKESILVEILRWIGEIFDRVVMQDPSTASGFHAPPLSRQFFTDTILFLHKHVECRWVSLLGSKAIGVVAMNEHNRRLMSADVFSEKQTGLIFSSRPKIIVRYGMLGVLVEQTNRWVKDESLLCNALWGLVVLGRPTGGIEGEAYHQQGAENFVNVHRMQELRGFAAGVLDIIHANANNPSVLSKCFWLIVNLSLVDKIKDELITRRIVHILLEAMAQYPNDKELQYRACFALINLSIKERAKSVMANMNGVRLVLESMQRYPDFERLQQCCCNVFRSLLWSGTDKFGITDQLVMAKALPILNQITANHPTSTTLQELAGQLIIFLNGNGW